MTDFIATVTCPVSTLNTIAEALTRADVRSDFSLLSDDKGAYKNARSLAWTLLFDAIHSVPGGYQLYTSDAEAPQTQDVSLSECVAF